MPISRLLIANRGEIAIRIARAAADLGIATTAVYTPDDEASLHTRMADSAVALPKGGAAGYLDMQAVIAAAKESGCDAVHPGYGFLAERAEFARSCAEAGLTFVGPSSDHLELFGDKGRARAAALAADVPVARGYDRAVTLEEARAFFSELGAGPGGGGAMIIKAVAGGGGRGTRAVLSADDIDAAFERCRSEAKAAFGDQSLYVEQFLPRARHVEVQVLGDATGRVAHLGERECSVQRRFQKVVEIAPAPGLDASLRRQIIAAAVRLAGSVGYRNLGTFEFLVDATGRVDAPPFIFIEANARLQVEHTVTEQVTGVDIVQAQLRLAGGESLADLGLDDERAAEPRGYAIQCRVNMETPLPDGSVRPGGGTLSAYDPPSGPGVRVDGFGYAGYTTSGLYDSLLAKVICHSPSPRFEDAIARTRRALSEFRLEGVSTNISFLQNVLASDDFAQAAIHTRWVDEQIAALAAPPAEQRQRYVASTPPASEVADGFAGARVRSDDPLALFAHDQSMKAQKASQQKAQGPAQPSGPDGSVGMVAPIQGTIVAIAVAEGDTVLAGQPVAVVEAMKMEHEIKADRSGVVRQVTMAAGDVVREGYPIVFIEERDVEGAYAGGDDALDLDHIRGDLQEAIDRHALTLDENRPGPVAKRHNLGYRTPRENIADLVDEGSFEEYWPLVVTKQHQRYDLDTLREKYPGDGVVAGMGAINGDLFPDEQSRACVVHYDYTVLAGTQGRRNHYKQDRHVPPGGAFRLAAGDVLRGRRRPPGRGR